jgi:hypothetical protein
LQWTSLLTLFVFVSLWSRPNPLSLQLATESPPVHQRHCTSSGTLFIVAFTPPQLCLHAPRTRLNISLLALAPSPLHLTLPPLTFDIYPPLHRGLSYASALRSLFFTHSHTVYVYIYPTQPIALTLAAVDLIRRQTALPLVHTEPMSVAAECAQLTCGFRHRH